MGPMAHLQAGHVGQELGSSAMASREPAGSPAAALASRRVGKRSRRTGAHPRARRRGWLDRRRGRPRGIWGSGGQNLQGKRRPWRLLSGLRLDSCCVEEEDGEAEVHDQSAELGAAPSGGGRRRPWRRARSLRAFSRDRERSEPGEERRRGKLHGIEGSLQGVTSSPGRRRWQARGGRRWSCAGHTGACFLSEEDNLHFAHSPLTLQVFQGKNKIAPFCMV
jgi:hypothetical protein